MMAIALQRFPLLLSGSLRDGRLFYTWVLFLLRFAGSPTRNPVLGSLLRTYESHFTNAILVGIRRIGDQRFALKTLVAYLNALKLQGSPGERRPRPRLKSLEFSDFRACARPEAIEALLAVFELDPKYVPLSRLIPFLKAAFDCGDDRLIGMAVAICGERLTAEKIRKYTTSLPIARKFFSSCFAAMGRTGLETAVAILRQLPALSAFYLEMESHDAISSSTIECEEFGFDLSAVATQMTENASDDPETICSVFVIVAQFFDVLARNLHRSPREYKGIMRTLVTLLCRCWAADFLRPRIRAFVSHLVPLFADAFVMGESNTFFLSALEVAGAGRCASSQFAMRLAKTFLQYLIGRPFAPETMSATVDRLLSFFSPETHLFSLLSGLALVTRFFPSHVRLDHLRSLLIQTTEIGPADRRFAAVLNRMLKEFLAGPAVDRAQFVQLVYDIICPLAMCVRFVLMKRVAKLGVPLAIRAIGDIERGQNPVLWYQRLALAFLCGLQEPIAVSADLRDEVCDIVANQAEISRILCLVYTILSRREIFLTFQEDGELPPTFYALLFNTLGSKVYPVQKLAKKCFRIMKRRLAADLNLSTIFEEMATVAEKTFQVFASSQDRIGLYMRLIKIFPDRIPPYVITTFFRGVFRYAEHSTGDKMAEIVCFINIMKVFTIREFTALAQVQAQILGHFQAGLSYLDAYIARIARIFQHPEIPLVNLTWKYVMRFLGVFARRTVDSVIKVQPSLFTFALLEDLIVKDRSSTFFDAFMHAFAEIAEYTAAHALGLKLIARLSRHARIAANPTFLRTVHESFVALLHKDALALDDFPALADLGIALSRSSSEPHHLLTLSKLFTIPYFAQSEAYREFVRSLRSKSPEFLEALLEIVSDSLTELSPLAVNALLPKIVKCLPRLNYQALWERVSQLLGTEEYAVPLIRTVIQLLLHGYAPQRPLEAVVQCIRHWVPSSNPELCVYSLKLCITLTNMRLLPTPVYYSVLRQLFAYAKFSELPFTPHFLAFLRARPDLIDKMQVSDVEILVMSLQDRFSDRSALLKLLSPSTSLLFAAPCLVKKLPFSIVAATAAFALPAIEALTADDDVRDIVEVLGYLIAYCELMPITRDEAKIGRAHV
jgi:hypothetical protein